MPGPITHQIFYKALKKQLNSRTLAAMPEYDQFSIFAQGHDLLIYHDFYKVFRRGKLAENISQSDQLQERCFSQFIYSYLRHAKELGVLRNEQVRLFIGAGYIGHHLLDACTHPFIIYLAGDHVRDPKRPTWMHGIVENYIDIYMMEEVGRINPASPEVYRSFSIARRALDPALQAVLDASLRETYGIKDGGKKMCRAMSQVELFMRVFKYDASGRKRSLFDLIDPIFKGTASFSYHRDSLAAEQFLNRNHEPWCNPMDDRICSNASFPELFHKALLDTAKMIERLEPLCQSGKITPETVFEIVPDIASTHGLACGKALEIRFSKEKSEEHSEAFSHLDRLIPCKENVFLSRKAR